MNIFLVGYRCTGKTSVGRLLAEKTGWPLVDTDAEIVALHQRSILEIIRMVGWRGFRDSEHGVIQKTCAADRQIVATGGGAVLDPRNIDAMKRAGITVWLTAHSETIRKRLTADAASRDLRPALSDQGAEEEIEEILSSRTPYYQAAKDFTVDTDRLSVSEVCRIILNRLSEKYGIVF